jgi:hypothetical protein
MIPIELKDCVGKPFCEAVARVLEYSRCRHPEPIRSIGHGLEIIASEFEEARDATDKDDIFMELASVAAMCQRTIEDVPPPALCDATIGATWWCEKHDHRWIGEKKCPKCKEEEREKALQ